MLTGPTNHRRRLGADLRDLRERRGLRIEEVADHLGVVASTLSRIETGKAPTKTSYLKLLLDLYGVDDQARRRELANLAREGQRKGWWAPDEDVLRDGYGAFLGLEADAVRHRIFVAQAVPVLLQTEPYAAAVVAAARPELSAEQQARLVAVQLRRQHVLDRLDSQCGEQFRLDVVLDEAVLLRAMGDPWLMRDQLERLAQTASRPGVTIRVLSLATGGARAPVGSFGILSFPAGGGPDVAGVEGVRAQVLLEQRPAEVGALGRLFASLEQAALPVTESLNLIRELAGDGVRAG
ncbi:MAG TPA: helix-turn-helix transcriptional regulator [Streptosporangiaceae bacterium]